jgi:DNA-binding GntR family transcriptional regulator
VSWTLERRRADSPGATLFAVALKQKVVEMFERSSLSEQVEIALRNEITSGRMAPGQKISAADLKAAWKISSTPLRDAVRSLEMQGFVIVEARKGIYVAPIDATAVNEIFDLRIALECMAVERATPLTPEKEAARILNGYLEAQKAAEVGDFALAAKTDRTVHDLARANCGNDRLQKALASHMELIRWAQRTINRKMPSAFVIALPEHIAIMKAVSGRDAEGAARAMRRHLESSRERLKTQLAAGGAEKSAESEEDASELSASGPRAQLATGLQAPRRKARRGTTVPA